MATYETSFGRDVDYAFRRMGITGTAAALLMVIFGVLILVFPALVAILVGLYLIVVGLLQLLAHMENRSPSSAPPPAPPAPPPVFGPPIP